MKKNENDIIIYQASSGALELRGDIKNDTIWATQLQIANVFGIDRSVVTKHINNLFNSGEIIKKSNVQKMHIANSDKPVNFYNLDIILAIGYRANSGKAIDFRRWSSGILKDHIIKGYTINPVRIEKNYVEFIEAVNKVKALLPTGMKPDTESILELIKVFADTWLSLDAYDKENYQTTKITKKKITLTAHDLLIAIAELKKSLIKKGEATDIFASERSRGSIEGVIGNVMQSFGGKDVYLSVEEKAAHLLYFMIKNHPFVDGNKRSGAFAFVWFLQRSKLLNISRLSPVALTALTLLIAESNSKDKDKMTGLVVMLLKKK